MVEGSIKRAVVFGASGGIGAAVASQLRQSGDYEVLTTARSGKADFHFDLTDETSIAHAAQMIGNSKPIDFVLVATGLLHRGKSMGPEKSWRALDPATMSDVFTVNAIGHRKRH